MWPLLLGVNLGPMLVLTGSLAGLLWQAGARRAGVEIDARRYTRVGVAVGLPAMVGGGGRAPRARVSASRPDGPAGAEVPDRGAHGEWRENGDVHAAAVRFDLHIPQSRSLKAKRAAIRPIVDGLRHRFRVSVAEVDHHDQWQRTAIAVAAGCAAPSRSFASCSPRSSDSSSRRPDVELLDVETAWLESERA